MANRRTYADVINPGNNPNTQYQNQSSTHILDEQRIQPMNNRSAEELRQENDKLRIMIKEMEERKPQLEE